MRKRAFPRKAIAWLCALALGVTMLPAVPAAAATVYGVTSPTHRADLSACAKTYGIDVSKHQGDIDWAAVKASGIQYVVIRLGYRGYGTTGNIVVDTYYRQNIAAAQAAGLETGVYFYTQAITTAEAVAEANTVIENLKGYAITLPVYFDIETATDDGSGRLDAAGLSKAKQTALCRAFCDKIEAAGYTAGVYANKYWLESEIDGAGLSADYEIWLAHYTTATTYAGAYKMWQFSSTAVVDGVEGDTDLNVRYDSKPAQVTGLAADADESGAATLSWDAVAGADFYRVYQYDYAKAAYTLLGETARPAFSATYTAAADTSFAVRAVQTIFGIAYTGTLSAPLLIPAGFAAEYPAPANFRRSASTENAITLSWSAAAGAVYYRLYLLDPETGYQLYAQTDACKAAVTGLDSATDYSFCVCGVFAGTAGDAPGVFTNALTTATDPAQVTGLSLTSYTTVSDTLAWDAVPAATGYQIYAKAPTETAYKKLATVSATSYTAAGLTAAATYSYQVRAYRKSAGVTTYGLFSDALDASTRPLAVKDLKIASYGADSVKLSWTAGGACDGYRIYLYNPADKSGKFITSTTATQVVLDGLTPGQTYTWRVAAAVKSSRYFLSGGGIIEGACAPAAVTKLAVSAYTGTSVTLSWAKNNTAAGYVVYRYDKATKTYVSAGKTTSTSFSLSGLTRNTTYPLRVKAFYTAGGKNFFSAAADLTASTAPNLVTGLKASAVTSKTATLKWTAAQGADSYRIYRVSADGTSTYLTAVTKPTCALKSLSAKTTYTFRVYASKTIAGKAYRSAPATVSFVTK
ncbi:MAG: fibronectin type III domain-containing protein [Oscillospiraceae bacterium]